MNTDRLYSLREASELANCSEGRFRYNKDKLTALGATISDTLWLIPHSTLVKMGWIDPNTAVRPLSELSPLTVAHNRIAELTDEVEHLRAQVEGQQKRNSGGLLRRLRG